MRWMWIILLLACAVVVTAEVNGIEDEFDSQENDNPDVKSENISMQDLKIEALRFEVKYLKRELRIKELAFQRYVNKTVAGAERNKELVSAYESLLDGMMKQLENGTITMEQMQNHIAPLLMECKKEMTEFESLMEAARDFSIFQVHHRVVWKMTANDFDQISQEECTRISQALTQCCIEKDESESLKFRYDNCLRNHLMEDLLSKVNTCIESNDNPMPPDDDDSNC